MPGPRSRQLRGHDQDRRGKALGALQDLVHGARFLDVVVGPDADLVEDAPAALVGDQGAVEPEVDECRQRLDGPLFRMDVTFDQDTWPGVAWRGEGADAVKGDAPIVAEMPWRGVGAVDEIGPDVRVPADATSLTSDELDALRIGANWPAEAEIDGKATPAMTGIVEDTVSFEKGCYTGQEFVARVHYRDAAPPRQLVQIMFEPGADVAAGAEMDVVGEPVGTVTSCVSALGVGLGYCKRSVSLPAEGVVGSTAVALS